jgi:hypothetical protein
MRKIIDNQGVIRPLFDGEEIPDGWTEIIEKYKRYKAPNGDIHTVLSDVTPGEGWVEEEIDFLGQPDPAYVPPYTAFRAMNYPQVTDQLDMLFHELKNNGTISTDGTWFQTINDIKNQYPKV